MPQFFEFFENGRRREKISFMTVDTFQKELSSPIKQASKIVCALAVRIFGLAPVCGNISVSRKRRLERPSCLVLGTRS